MLILRYASRYGYQGAESAPVDRAHQLQLLAFLLTTPAVRESFVIKSIHLFQI